MGSPFTIHNSFAKLHETYFQMSITRLLSARWAWCFDLANSQIEKQKCSDIYFLIISLWLSNSGLVIILNQIWLIMEFWAKPWKYYCRNAFHILYICSNWCLRRMSHVIRILRIEEFLWLVANVLNIGYHDFIKPEF